MQEEKTIILIIGSIESTLVEEGSSCTSTRESKEMEVLIKCDIILDPLEMSEKKVS